MQILPHGYGPDLDRPTHLSLIGLVLWNNYLELQRIFNGDLQFTVDSEPRPVKAAQKELTWLGFEQWT